MKKKKKKKKEDEEGAEGEAAAATEAAPAKAGPRPGQDPGQDRGQGPSARNSTAKSPFSSFSLLSRPPPLRVQSARHGRIADDRRADPAGLSGFIAKGLAAWTASPQRTLPTMAIATPVVAPPRAEGLGQPGGTPGALQLLQCLIGTATVLAVAWLGWSLAGPGRGVGWLAALGLAVYPTARSRGGLSTGGTLGGPAVGLPAGSGRLAAVAIQPGGRRSGRLPGRLPDSPGARRWSGRPRSAWRSSGGGPCHALRASDSADRRWAGC